MTNSLTHNKQENDMINYSIIIPHFNIPKLLGRCLRSIPERGDVQVIVVDDNSPGNEKYLDTLPELKRKNVEFYVTKDGLGAGHARNVGLSHAIGKWLIFSDSDDFFDNSFSQILDEYVNDDHDIIYFGVKICDSDNPSHVHDTDRFQSFHETGNEMCLRFGHAEPWGKIIKRSFVVENNIVFQEVKANNDLLFSVKAGFTADSIAVDERTLYWYGVREGSLGHHKGIEPFEKICDRVMAWRETLLFLEKIGIKTTMYLPYIPSKRLLKRPAKYVKLLLFMRKNNVKWWLVLRDTVRYVYYSFFNVEALKLYNLITKESAQKFKKTKQNCAWIEKYNSQAEE